ncbi:MoaD/ThiS family protein [bacterium]|nr:MoaD/ThiS family protein [bacterium]
MAQIHFTHNLERHVACPSARLPGATVAELLAAYFAAHPRARGYVLDDRGALRTHMTVFVDGTAVRDRAHLSDPVAEDSDVYVMQALSGG